MTLLKRVLTLVLAFAFLTTLLQAEIRKMYVVSEPYAPTYQQWNSVTTENFPVFNSSVWSSAATAGMQYVESGITKSASWVSYAQTGYEFGPNYIDVGIGTVVDFFHVFTVPGNPVAATLKIMAADTAVAFIRGDAPPAAFPDQTLSATYYGCDSVAPGCRFNAVKTISFTATGAWSGNTSPLNLGMIQRGANRLLVRAKKQINRNLASNKTGFGVMYLLEIEYEVESCQP